MDAFAFKVRTPQITGGKSHTPLAKTDLVSIGLNYYSPGRKNTLHTHPGEDHAFIVLDGEATFYDKNNNATVLKKGEGIMLPEGWYYWFQSTGEKPLALLRFSGRKARPNVLRIDVQGRTRTEDEEGYQSVDGKPIEGQYWEMS
ncbi:MAG: cupin domain-containing protein [Candidatus Binatia bacterium]